ncbi:subtilisin-like proprotein convertase family protein [Dyadobacter sp. BE34]|uniref:Subtilisin-like proprotein convertase family protein n=1 Tax=Dyadobacter fermentans TaxID=94254 RepID=A0ABU1R6F4_9BACT|nr:MULTISPECIES: proprotein convertase P-domain-containing protein [Dyadobacter]MDR6808943.1 subtilisin-like proprotein convertase family protein [Dyadobacter fermentans]MDR7046686.1 subtilisin-like proprotein convertase family protein [Dyadobacter sp. BE242]MDR7201000.1 subtilisin-like proprotein convertase family protein [Dyadobacter sp. BE34]MDR7218960.1 subtilisin-like proprotein convertase family protein [Dyadobacter sp. BE31]MDR7264830.1 subtilisin-like proprotein convertase family prote
MTYRFTQLQAFSRFSLLLFFLSFLSNQNLLHAQYFNTPGAKIRDFEGVFRIDSIPITVSGLPLKIDSSFGLAKVCLNIDHLRTSDLKIELLSPDGTSIWLTNRNGSETGQNYMNTCFRSNGFNGYIHSGKAPFAGEFIPDGRMSFLNNSQNPNGIWYLLVQDLAAGKKGVLNYFNLEFSANPNPNSGLGGCSFESPELCRMPEKGTALLPDLVTLPFFTDNQIKEYPQDDQNYPGQLKLAISIANLGDGPMEVFGLHEWRCADTIVDSTTVCPDGKKARQILYQRIYSLSENKKLSYTDVPTNSNYYDDKPGHNHYHVDDWVEFRLVKVKRGRKGRVKHKEVIAQSSKISYCLFDSGICNDNDNICRFENINYGAGNLANYGLGAYSSCHSSKQGISVGAYDTYGMMYEGQFLTIPKGTRNGDYLVEVELDPLNKVAEKNKANNLLSFPITLRKQVP